MRVVETWWRVPGEVSKASTKFNQRPTVVGRIKGRRILSLRERRGFQAMAKVENRE